MTQSSDEIIQLLYKVISDKDKTIDELQKTIEQLNSNIANLTESIGEMKRKLFGISSEKLPKADRPAEKELETGPAKTTEVKAHTRTSKPKSVRKDLYESLSIKRVDCPVPEEMRFCPDCDTPMVHMGYSFVREELHIIPAKVCRIQYYQEKLKCPACEEEGDTTILAARTPSALLKHSPASPDMVAEVMYQKVFMDLPFYRQEKYWKELGVPLPRETAANWFNTCALEYLDPVYQLLHKHLLEREVVHADEVPCQVLHEEGKDASSKSYIWVYLTGTDSLPKIVLYDYKPGRSGAYPAEFLKGFHGMLHCDGYQGYNRVEDVTRLCCLAHCRRKFFEALPAGSRRKQKLLDVHSSESIPDQPEDIEGNPDMLPAEKGVAFCNKLFFLEQLYKELPSEERKAKRLEKEPDVWNRFWTWVEGLEPSGGSKLEKAVNYARNHKEMLMNYLQDGRCEISNNAAERSVKSYVMARKNFLFHDQADGAAATAVVFSLTETAKANNLNVYQYLYMLLLYMPDYKEKPAGIEQLLPWSDFIKERCSGVTDTETIRPENREDLPA